MKVQLPILFFCASVLGYAAFAPTGGKRVTFNRDVKPILSENCFKCHGPDAAVAAGGLRLDSFREATKRAIIPGKPEKSLLYSRISIDIESMRMPPPASGMHALTKEQQEIIRRWIADGAKYEDHWSFVAPKKPPIPAVSDYRWPRNFVDRFVMRRLDQEGLKPEPEADRRTLLRRAALALTGLPPTPEEIRQFEGDQSPTAYENAVDRYLASPRYGEHQARYWLDAVRYADTHGLHFDNERAVFPYRDWVVQSFNKDLPFDKFTLWQVAGDLFPKPSLEQLVATGYVRMNPTTNEGGVIEEEFLAKNTFDRVDTTSTVFLGLTVGCARCHDHKYDPIRQKDYFGLYAFFNSTQDRPLDGNELAPGPAVSVPSQAQERRLSATKSQIRNLVMQTQADQAKQWLGASLKPALETNDWEISPVYAEENFDKAFDGVYPPERNEGQWKPFAFQPGKESASIIGKDNASVYVRGVVVSPMEQDFTFRVSSDDGIKIWLNGAQVHNNKALRGVASGADDVKVRLKAGPNKILFKVVNGGAQDGLLFRTADANETRIEELRKKIAAGTATPEEINALYLEIGPESDAAKDYRRLVMEQQAVEKAVPKSLVAMEMDKPRPAYVLRRGEYNLKGDEVGRQVPLALGHLPKWAPRNRLGLAEWMVAPENPLVSRVFVNRVWQQHFGTGLVKTSEDFGSQGEYPVNLPLLDYLAVTFRESGWSMKKLHRLLVTSAAFRQRAASPKAKVERDPENRLVSRGPRFRLDAEVIRDATLAASGLLEDAEGGRGFRPYQPDGLWEAIGFPGSDTGVYMRDKDDSIYRRSLYLFWKRTSPHPVMLAFDAPMREACTVRRSRTNTPLQALTSMNEPMFVEAAKNLAARLMKEAKDDDSRLVRAYELTVGRPPSERERTVLAKALDRYRAKYANDPEGAKKLLEVGDSKVPTTPEVAAWTLVCNTLLNTDEFLTQH